MLMLREVQRYAPPEPPEAEIDAQVALRSIGALCSMRGRSICCACWRPAGFTEAPDCARGFATTSDRVVPQAALRRRSPRRPRSPTGSPTCGGARPVGCEVVESTDQDSENTSPMPQRRPSDDSPRARSAATLNARVAGDVGDDAAALQIHHSPEGAEQPRDDRRVPPLQRVAEAERDARDDEPDRPAAQPLFEAVEQKRALHLFAHAAGDRPRAR